MKIFSEKHQELKDFEEIILNIEKERDTLDYYHASIQKWRIYKLLRQHEYVYSRLS